MEKIDVVKLFIIHAKENNILELNRNELRENFFKFKNSEVYKDLLSDYEYDENNICLKFEVELATLTMNKSVQLYQDYIYIYTIDTEYKNEISPEINNLVRKMVSDYINLNMQKQKVKMD